MTELELLNSIADYRVMFCGETITDTYHYVRPLGRPTKDAIVSVEIGESETFKGGIDAAAAHARGFVKQVDTFTGGDVIEKVRYVEKSHMHKLFNVYVPKSTTPIDNHSQRPTYLHKYDVVAVIDYGHGMATPDFIDELSGARYLAINVQTNSGNYGFNLATKYKYCDYLCVDESEARLATQNRSGNIQESVVCFQKIASKICVTLGKDGSMGWSEKDGFVTVQAFTDKVVDTMGAGDAFFAVTALVAKKADITSLLRIGNAAAAIKSQVVGHRSHVTKDELIRYLAQVR